MKKLLLTALLALSTTVSAYQDQRVTDPETRWLSIDFYVVTDDGMKNYVVAMPTMDIERCERGMIKYARHDNVYNISCGLYPHPKSEAYAKLKKMRKQ